MGDLENNLKGLFDTFLVNYNLVHRALMAKAVPIATLLVEKRQQHNEILRYLFAQGSDKDNWPNANVFEPCQNLARNAYRILNSYSDRFKSLFRKARNGIAINMVELGWAKDCACPLKDSMQIILAMQNI